MGAKDPGDPVYKRTMFYDVVRREHRGSVNEYITFLPMYQVQYSPSMGAFFEPVDFMGRRQMGGESSTFATSVLGQKEVNEMVNLNGNMKMAECGMNNMEPGVRLVLHSFGWSWPLA